MGMDHNSDDTAVCNDANGIEVAKPSLRNIQILHGHSLLSSSPLGSSQQEARLPKG